MFIELKNGVVEYKGGTGPCASNAYKFKNGSTSYILEDSPCAAEKDAPPYQLKVVRNSKEVAKWDCG
ncbi:MAG: hypothetical protein EOP04_02975 [Proteobacteria bacterium]|nr:MAG: hypothetical protein EOP04_02975 [Pseudomonadota bacterium]